MSLLSTSLSRTAWKAEVLSAVDYFLQDSPTTQQEKRKVNDTRRTSLGSKFFNHLLAIKYQCKGRREFRSGCFQVSIQCKTCILLVNDHII